MTLKIAQRSAVNRMPLTTLPGYPNCASPRMKGIVVTTFVTVAKSNSTGRVLTRRPAHNLAAAEILPAQFAKADIDALAQGSQLANVAPSTYFGKRVRTSKDPMQSKPFNSIFAL